MKYIKRKQKLSRALFAVLAAGLFLSSAFSHSASAQRQFLPLESMIQIPMATIDANVYPDISRIDWNQKLVINGKSTVLDSDESLSVLNIPYDIKTLIREYRSDKTAIDRTIFMWPSTKTEKKGYLDEGLRFSIAKKLIDKGQLPADYFDLEAKGLVQPGNNVINAAGAGTLDPASITGVEPSAEILDVRPVDTTKEAREVSFIERIVNAVQGTFTRLVAWLFHENALADVATVSEEAIDYLIDQQNEDGSWGSATSTRFITTAAVLDALHSHGVTGTSTDDGLAWLDGYVTENNYYLAEQVKVLAQAGMSTTTAQALAHGLNESTGGFVFNRGYEADPLTTAKAIQALFEAGYEDPGESPTHTESLAINYLINTQRFDKGWGSFEGGVSSIPATSEAIEALLLYKHQSLGSIEVDDTLDPAVASLTNTQQANGTWGDDLLNTALAYRAIKASGQIPTYQLQAIEYFEDEQEGNGSFDNDAYKTAKVLEALSIATNSGQLVIDDIVPLTAIQTGTTTQFNIVISNPGNVAVDSGLLHIITDDYYFASFDFDTYNIVVNASSSVNLTVGINNTRNFLGNVVFKVFVEGTNEVIHPGSRYQETLTYAADPANRPALPMYFVAYKNVSGAGTPAITWRWPNKADPNLKNYVLMWRKVGVGTWSMGTVTTTASSATLGGLTNNDTYEATMGTLSQGGQIYFFSGASSVRVSSSTTTYIGGSVEGTVKALDGTVADVSILGVTASTTALAGENGEFLQANVPWGSGYARVSDFRYENYVKKYATADTSITDVDVYTNLKPDTANPTVTNVLIVGESDYEMENKEKELIQYTVNDDIGSGGNGIVQSASFYYYDPNSSNWHIIGTEQGFLTGTRTYEWDIPGNLVGTGYKVRVIVRDFAGKDSSPAEWGPFELTPGNASPTLTFTAPVAGVSANADQSYVIRWTDGDPDDNATTTLSYDPDNNPNNANHVFITTVMEDDPTDEYVWDTSGIATSTQYIRADLVDGHNGTTTVYSTGVVNISH